MAEDYVSSMRAARLSGQCQAVAQVNRTLSSVLMNHAHNVHEQTVDKKKDSTMTTKPMPTLNAETQAYLETLLERQAAMLTEKFTALLAGGTFASVAPDKPTPTIPVTHNINHCIVGKTLFMAVSLDDDIVMPDTNASDQRVYAHIRTPRKNAAKYEDGHSLVINGLNVTMSVIDMGNNAQGKRDATPPNKLAAALLGLPETAIAECVAVYRKDEPSND